MRPVQFSLLSVKLKVSIVLEEEMGGTETDERDAPRPQTKIDATGAPWISTKEGVDPEALITISQAAGVTSIAGPLKITHPAINRR